MISREAWDDVSRNLFAIIEKTINQKSGVMTEIFAKKDEDIPSAQNIVVTLTPEAMLTILICVGAADKEAVDATNVKKAYHTDVKPASTISLYHTLREQARQAGVIK